MPSNVRERMIAGALDLLSRHGLQSTSFAEVTQATKTPRGSIYHHFPGGKQELVLAALDRQGAVWREAISAMPRRTPQEFISGIVDAIRASYRESEFRTGTAVGAVTVAYENEEQLDRCATTFDVFLDCVRQGLVEAGVEEDAARTFASLTLQMFAGSTMVTRAVRSPEHFELASAALIEGAARLPLVSSN